MPPRFLSRPLLLQSLNLRRTFKPVSRERASPAPIIWSKPCPTEDEACICTVRIVLRKRNQNGRRNRQDCRGNLASAQHPRRIVAHTTEEPGESPVFDWAIGWLAREDQIVIPARSALSESAGKGDGRFTRFEYFPWGKQG